MSGVLVHAELGPGACSGTSTTLAVLVESMGCNLSYNNRGTS